MERSEGQIKCSGPETSPGPGPIGDLGEYDVLQGRRDSASATKGPESHRWKVWVREWWRCYAAGSETELQSTPRSTGTHP